MYVNTRALTAPQPLKYICKYFITLPGQIINRVSETFAVIYE